MKKFLALVLALVMTMSLVTISAGAEDFTDADKVTYSEAVDVMTAAGVVGGYADGSFNPTAGLTRGAAAKIICNMILGPTTAEALVANDAPFSDVAVDNVFAGYIAYCVNEGIISGYADGTFKPAAPLTGYAFMKMLLGALGYDADVEGYVGSNWSIQVAKKALYLELNKGLVDDFAGAKALTREEACLYAFNAMNTKMVEYPTSSTITVGDIVIKNNSTASDAGMPLFRAKFFKDLDKVTGQNDVYGRPAHTWKWDGDKIGTYADTADYTVVLGKTYTTLAALVKDVLDETDDDLNADAAIAGGDTWFNGAALANKTAVETKLGTEAEAGTVIELFVNDDDVTVDAIVAYNYDIAEIVSVTNKVSAAAAKKGATTSIKLEYADESTATKYDEFENTPASVLAGFDAETYTEGTMIAVVLNGSTIIDSCVVDSVSGKISSFKQNTHAVVDGTKYVLAGDVALTAVDFDEEYTLYLDPNGYVLKVAGDFGATIDDVFYITGVYQDVDSKDNVVKYAETVSLTGEVADKVISDAAFTTLSGGVGFVDTAAGLYTMTLNADDKYDVVAFTNAHADYDVKEDASMTDDVKVDAASATIGSKVYFDAATQFVSVKTTAAGAVKEVKAAEGGMSYAGANAAKAIVITEQDERDALYVLYVGATMSSTVVTDDVVFVSAVSTEEDSAETFLTSVVYMADNAEDEMSVKTASAKAVGFYKYALNADNQYELTSVDRHTGTVDEDTTGWAYLGFEKAGIHGTTVTSSGLSNFEDIKFGSATVVDLRTDATIEGDTYDREILTVSDLIDAADVAEMAAYCYIVDGVITFIAVEYEV